MPPNAEAINHNNLESLPSGNTDEGSSKQTGVLFETDADTDDGALDVDVHQRKCAEKRKLKLVWRNIIIAAYIHIAALYGGWLIFTSAKWPTVFFSIFLYSISILGTTAGAHRLWAHRSYKAKWPLRLILVAFQTVAFQDAAYHWVRDHRVHHKFSETDADPHNATRGFFFSHIGWLLCKKHPDVRAKGKSLDLTDLHADRILMWQNKNYLLLMPLACFILPTILPMYCWNESFINSWYVAAMFRWCFSFNITCCVNSAAHIFGGRPYDKNINPSQCPSVSMFTFGEGWHNYHHVFPWDYKTSEWGNYSLNLTTAFIDFFAKIGWAYDLKSVSTDIIEKRVKRTGDGSHELWGYGDKDITKEDEQGIITINKKSE